MLRKNTLSVLVAALIFAVGVALAYGVFLYIVRQGQGEIDERKHMLAEDRYEGMERADLSRNFEELAAKHEELNGYFIREENIVDFLESIETFGRSRGATVSTASLKIEELDDRFSELEVDVKASGTFRAVEHVLELLESLPYKSKVIKASIEYRGLEVGSGKWEGTFTLTVIQHTAL